MSGTDDYPYIRLWGQRMGSFQYYIDDQIEQAREDGAPANATHRYLDGTWATTDDITDPAVRKQFGLPDLVGQ
ncbi:MULTISPECIES: hypothetical protein [Mycolicibacter]|uniref:Uncharacterized protein n=1 Tax=Mycolicibacter longobardus TaxID=1108812 RepID=A0A1X1YBI3_9MYCO|nr:MULTISPECIES: hypothetical protein [Mycolicibacter]ORW08468.1 hypothetical protein AWC16_18885 [Mycolicibacter longobardus]RAV04423.1 hypothetical protein DQP56_00985 [Mycolicibacter senuensis]